MRNPATRIVIAFALVFAAAGPTFVAAQPRQDWRAEVFASAGATGLSRYEDQGFGRHSDFGVGAAFRVFPRFAVQVEVDHVFGLPAGPSGCVANDPCAAAAASVAGLFLLSTSRVQPYVMGGMVFLRTETADYVVAPATAASRTSDTGVGPLVGGGARIFITRAWYLQPSFYAGTAVWLSRSNLSTSRASIAVGYRW